MALSVQTHRRRLPLPFQQHAKHAPERDQPRSAVGRALDGANWSASSFPPPLWSKPQLRRQFKSPSSGGAACPKQVLTQPEQALPGLNGRMGAPHGADIPFIFDNWHIWSGAVPMMERATPDTIRALTEAMHGASGAARGGAQ